MRVGDTGTERPDLGKPSSGPVRPPSPRAADVVSGALARVGCGLIVLGVLGCGKEPVVEPPAAPPATEAPTELAVMPVPPRPAGGVGVEPDGGAAFGRLLREEPPAPMGLGMRGEGPQNGGPKYPGLAGAEGLGHGSGGGYGAGPVPARDDAPENLGTNLWADRAVVSDGMDADAVTTAVRSRRARLAYCYGRGTDGAAREDVAEATLSIAADGTCTAALVGSATLAEPIRTCIAQQLRGATFPARPGVAKVPLRLAVRTCGSCD